MKPLLLLLACLPLCGQAITGVLTPLDGLRWSVEIYGPPGTTLARSRILAAAHAPVGFLLRDQAAAVLQRSARDARASKLSSVGAVGLPLCASAAGIIAAKTHGAAAYGTMGTALVCGLWAVLHTRVQADKPDPGADIAHLMPDAGVTLPWSGLLVAARPGGEAITFEVH